MEFLTICAIEQLFEQVHVLLLSCALVAYTRLLVVTHTFLLLAKMSAHYGQLPGETRSRKDQILKAIQSALHLHNPDSVRDVSAQILQNRILQL